MINLKSIVAHRWETLSKRAKGTAFASARVRDLAQSAGLGWYASRGDERLSDFLVYDEVDIFRIHSLGKKKIGRLCDILETLLDEDTAVVETVEIQESSKILETLSCWSIPENFPCSLISLPIRISHYCEENQITTLGDLLGEWQQLGFIGFKGKRNLGVKSVRELEAFVDSLVKGDAELASRFLPLAPEAKGADFAVSLYHVLMQQSHKEIDILMLRLIDGLTLEECAIDKNLSRERVRQLELNFLTQITLRLNYFQITNEVLLRAWVGSKDWFTLAKWNGGEDLGYLAKAALESIFRDSPHGVARELSEEMKMAKIEDELDACPDLWFGGTCLGDFLNNLDLDDRAVFCEKLTLSTRFTLDQATGRVHPARTDLRSCIMAILMEEDNPLPLTWLVDLVKKTGYFPKLERNNVIRARSRWRKRNDFPDQKILWDE